MAIVDTRAPLLTGLYETAPKLINFPPRIHQSLAKVLLAASPLHCYYKAFVEEVQPFDDARNFGEVCHSVLLGGKNVGVVDAPDWRTKDAREQRELIAKLGKLPVLQRRYDEAQLLAEHVKAEVSLSGRSETTALWQCNGVYCEGRIDHFIETPKSITIYDFKFINIEATRRACENRFIEYGLDIQHAAYVEAFETLRPEMAGRIKMVFIFVEVDPPNAIRIMPVAGSMRTSGIWRWEKAREIWRDCLEKYGTTTPWPGYADNGEAAECPPWALNASIEEERVREFKEAQSE